MLFLPHRIPCSFQVRGKTKILWSHYHESQLRSYIYFNIHYQNPKWSSDTNIFFLTVKTNAISTQVGYNSAEDIPGPCWNLTCLLNPYTGYFYKYLFYNIKKEVWVLINKLNVNISGWLENTNLSSSISKLDSLSDSCLQSASLRSISLCNFLWSLKFSSLICRSSSKYCAIFSESEIQNFVKIWIKFNFTKRQIRFA